MYIHVSLCILSEGLPCVCVCNSMDITWDKSSLINDCIKKNDNSFSIITAGELEMDFN